MNNEKRNTMSYVSLFDLKDRDRLDLYFKMKGKHGFCFSEGERESFMKECQSWVEAQLGRVDGLAIPETSNAFLIELSQRLSPKLMPLKKRSIEQLRLALDGQAMMRAEREKLYAAMDEMTDFKINLVAGNQRRRFESILFEPQETPFTGRLALLDDAVFGGSTQRAAVSALGREPDASIVLFSK